MCLPRSGRASVCCPESEEPEAKRAQRIQQVHKRKPDVGHQQSTERRAHNGSNLKNAVIPRHSVRKGIARNQRRKKRTACRPTECARHRSEKKKQIDQRNRRLDDAIQKSRRCPPKRDYFHAMGQSQEWRDASKKPTPAPAMSAG